jgi:predicted ATP-grasp superfamily ATP-dependent carboligase
MDSRFRGDDGRGHVKRVLLAGISTRAMAESAVRAGYQVLSVDAYADRDNLASPALSLRRDFGVEYSPRALADAVAQIDSGCDAVCYGSGMENHPDAVALLASRAPLWGNPPHVLRRARNAVALSRLLRKRLGIGALARASAVDSSRDWLMKPRASGGGHGISEWRSGTVLPRTHILQERIRGTPGSIAFVAHGGQAHPFAISRQLVGEAHFGASGFQYCGSIMSALPRSVIDIATDTAQILAEEFVLIGVAALDFVQTADGVPHAIELNPRYSASMELAERAFGYPVFAAHALACTAALSGAAALVLPSLDLALALRSSGAIGKAILFAPSDLKMPDTEPWLADPDVRDVPHTGETIPRGHPVCTIFVTAGDDPSCHMMLVRKAAAMYDAMQKTGSREQRAEGRNGESPRREVAESSAQFLPSALCCLPPAVPPLSHTRP